MRSKLFGMGKVEHSTLDMGVLEAAMNKGKVTMESHTLRRKWLEPISVL
jgi:hypothetical protein